jgi:hypothetical protein
MNTTELKFLVDVGVGKGVENFLSEAGYDTKAVRKLTRTWKMRKLFVLQPLKIVWL